MLMLSGIQHYVFCPRQWALIHIEQQWAENRLTAEGHSLHVRVDVPTRRVLNNNKLTLRSVHVASRRLGLYGVCDALELIPCEGERNYIEHEKYAGRYIPHPVEYKRGRSKSTECDIAQLVAQVMCLEEMHGIEISHASLFYWEVRRREEVEITDELRVRTEMYAQGMHKLYSLRKTPEAHFASRCKRCSLYDICLPEKRGSVEGYLKEVLE